MLLAAVILATGIVYLPLPTYVHPDWGPEPPVAPYSPRPLPHDPVRVPMIFPVIGHVRWHNDYGVSRGRYRHTGIDIPAPKMTPIVAPISGVLGMKQETFWIYAPNGFAVLGTHLNDDNLGKHDHNGGRDVMFAPDLQAGQTVRAGQFIGYVGMSGDATGPHLHFELYAPGPGTTMQRVRNPYLSLRAAQHIARPRLELSSSCDSAGAAQMGFEGYLRRINGDKGTVTFILLSRSLPGHRAVVTRPTWLTLHTDRVDFKPIPDDALVSGVFDLKHRELRSWEVNTDV